MIALIILFAMFLTLTFLGMPIGFSMGISGVFIMVTFLDVTTPAAATRMLGNVDSWSWLAIPLFILLGNLMSSTGITLRLVNFAMALVGHIRGGLSHVSVLTNTMMAGMSGSLAADAAAIGAIFGPAMEKAGYDRGYSASMFACGSIIGPLIPPSICFIILGITGNISVLSLYVGGIVPGFLVALTLIIAGYFLARKRGYPAEKKSSWKERGKTFVPALPALLIPVLIIGGMRIGMFTPTEAGAVGIVYAVVVGTVVYRETKLRDIPKVLVDSAKASGKAFFTFAAAGIFSWVLVMLKANDYIMALMAPILDPIIFLAIVFVIFTIMGFFLDGIPIILIFIPLLMPIVEHLGINPVHFGVAFGMCTLVGALTPPMAGGMFMVCAVTGATVAEYVRSGLILIILLMIVNLLVFFIPEISLFLPNLIMNK